MYKPATISRRGFLRALGVTSTSVLVPQLWRPDSPAMGADPAEPGADKSVYVFEYSLDRDMVHHLVTVRKESFANGGSKRSAVTSKETVWKVLPEGISCRCKLLPNNS